MTSTMFSNYQTNYYEPHENLSLQEMMDCDMHEMDFLSYDPLLQETVYSSPDFNRNFKQEGKLKVESNTPSPGDLTNLQWLQNVSIPMEKTTPQEQKQLMVDPNTGLPPQYTNQGTPLQQQQHFQHRPHMQPQQTRIDLVVESPKTPTKSSKPLNGKPGEKIYPKPVYSYSCLIAMALKNSDSGTLPVSEIYKFMQTHFPYFKTAPDGWKNSVRHNLSLNKAFCKLERPQGSSQRKGCLWSLKPEKREQMEKEIRKWKKKHEEALREHGIIPDNSLDHLIEASPEHIVPQITEIDDRAAADAAKELFGNDLLHDMQDEELWKEIMSSAEGLTDPVLTAATTAHTAPTNRYTDPSVTTVEIDSSSHYFNTVDYSQMNGSPYINSNYYTQANTLNVNGF